MRLRARFRLLRRRTSRSARRASQVLVRCGALVWQKLYLVRYRYLVWRQRYGAAIVAIMLLALIGLSSFSVSALQRSLLPIFATEAELASLGSFLLTLGGALIGAAAIVSSLVLFAMQVNVERMPHGLFRRLSADRRLLSAFAATFVLAVIIASLSLLQINSASVPPLS